MVPIACLCGPIVLHSRNGTCPCSGEGFRVFPRSRPTNYSVIHHTNCTGSYL